MATNQDIRLKIRKQIHKNVFVGLISSQVYIWVPFLLAKTHSSLQSTSHGFYAWSIIAVLLVVGFIAIRQLRNRDSSNWIAGALVVNFILLLLIDFSIFYWATGSSVNWNIPLSHLDAIYVSLGILSTAGAGSIIPISEHARAWVTLQMAVDLVSVPVILGLVVSRFWRHN